MQSQQKSTNIDYVPAPTKKAALEKKKKKEKNLVINNLENIGQDFMHPDGTSERQCRQDLSRTKKKQKNHTKKMSEGDVIRTAMPQDVLRV